MERSVVEVLITREGRPEVTVTQEKAVDASGKKRKDLLTEADFWDQLKKKAPQNYGPVKNMVDAYRAKPFIEVVPGVNGLRFRKILPEKDRRIGLFFIVTDGSINLRPQGMRFSFQAAGFDPRIIDDFSKKIKRVMNGKYRAFIEQVDLKKFNRIIDNFMERIDEQEISR